MSDENSKLPVRRFGRKDRKSRIETSGQLFPEEDFAPLEIPSANAAQTDADGILPFDDLSASPDDIDAALSSLTSLDELTHSLATSEVPTVKEQVAEGQAERFPPVRPAAPAAQPKTAPPKKRRGIARQDVIAFLFLLATFGIGAWFITVWQNPYSAANPFPPATPFRVITTTPLPPTQTLEPTIGPTASFTPLSGLGVTDGTAEIVPPTLDASSPLTVSDYPFTLAASGIIYIPNANGRECDWSSIAGTVTGMNGEALNNYGVEITGEGIADKVFSGTAQTFGPGGFELFLNGVPQQKQYTIQLFSRAGAPVSDRFPVITSDQCEQNVVIINFVQVREI